MVCVYCGNDTNVVNSRLQKRNNTVWRRRVCKECQATVTTLEKIDLETAVIVIDKTVHTPFSRDKLFISIFDSCKHRTTAQKDATALTDTIISSLYPLISDASINVETIKQTSADILKRFDKAAAVQYAAYHPVSKS